MSLPHPLHHWWTALYKAWPCTCHLPLTSLPWFPEACRIKPSFQAPTLKTLNGWSSHAPGLPLPHPPFHISPKPPSMPVHGFTHSFQSALDVFLSLSLSPWLSFLEHFSLCLWLPWSAFPLWLIPVPSPMKLSWLPYTGTLSIPRVSTMLFCLSDGKTASLCHSLIYLCVDPNQLGDLQRSQSFDPFVGLIAGTDKSSVVVDALCDDNHGLCWSCPSSTSGSCLVQGRTVHPHPFLNEMVPCYWL